jgi:hypothetical protein
VVKESLPTFLVIGAAKCGTTSLASYLAAHPNIGMATPKEVNFFSLHWSQGLDFYRRRFAGVPEDIAGEASPSYSRAPLIPGVPSRIASVVPDVRLIYLIRHPIDRMRSHYVDRLHEGRERAGTFSEALDSDRRYIDVSRYAYQIQLYLDHFPRNQLLVLTAEQLKADRETAMRRILTFLGADSSILPPNLNHELNSAGEKFRLARSLDPFRSMWQRARPVTGRIPQRWRHWLRSTLSRRVSGEALHLSAEQEERLWGELIPDLDRLRNIVDPAIDLWTPNRTL